MVFLRSLIKEFALKGNLVDMAIAFVMGGAFGKVVTAFVERCFAPITGMLLGGINLAEKKLILKGAVTEIKDASGVITTVASPELAIEWGVFITACIDFIIVAFVMFLIIKAMNRMKKEEPAIAAGPSSEALLADILAEMKKK
ncbi:MAG: large conductance mechanosensitive channel protein MscL [Chitinophagales bacterium]|nr:large conductance mechanosensitive channel protein MscL [Sphingobacteriales bacterium]